MDLLSRRSILSKKQVEGFLHAFTDLITAALKSGETVQMIPFGTFGTRWRKEKLGRNPASGIPMTIPQKRVVFFRPGKFLKKGY